jgi:DNA-binding response OmpR family regulator
MAASLLLIDADSTVTSKLHPVLVQDGYRVARGVPGLTALRSVLTDDPDLVILGVNCQGSDWQFCSRLIPLLDKPLLLLLATSNPMDQVMALEMGADDCMIQPVNMIELLARVRALLRRHKGFKRSTQRSYFVDGELIIDLTRREVWLDGQPVALTPTEFRLLSCFAQHVDEVLSHERLTMQVWGPEYSDARDAIKQYVHQLRRKLELDPRHPQRILTRWGEGYLFRALTQT